MRLGLAGGLVPRETGAVTRDLVRSIAALGITGVHTHFLGEVFDFSVSECRRVRELFAEAGIAIVHNWGWQPPLLHPEEPVRKRAAQTLIAALRVAADLGAGSVLTGPGSVNPAGPWSPAEYNFSDEAFDRLVASFGQAARAAEDLGVGIALEGHVLSAFRSCERMLGLIEAVGSRAIKVNYDPVNMVTHLNYYNTGAMVERDFRLLGDLAVSVHAKDVILRDRLVLHLDEEVPGRGNLDWPVLLRICAGMGRDFHVIMEHMDAADVPEAAEFLAKTASSLGLKFEGGR